MLGASQLYNYHLVLEFKVERRKPEPHDLQVNVSLRAELPELESPYFCFCLEFTLEGPSEMAPL